MAASSLAVSSAPGGALSTTAWTRFGSGSSGNGLAAWIWPSSSRVTTMTGAVTPSLAPIASVMARATSPQSASSGAVNSTFPLWMYVTTSVCPSSLTSVRRSAIATLFLLPRLIPRSNATCVAITPLSPARRHPLSFSYATGHSTRIGAGSAGRDRGATWPSQAASLFVVVIPCVDNAMPLTYGRRGALEDPGPAAARRIGAGLAVSVETLHPEEIKHDICVLSFRRMRNFHVVAADGAAAPRGPGPRG